MSHSRTRIGRSAEIAAAAELGRRGYRIVTNNYRCRFGEIDLIARDGDTLAFVEVRCRGGSSLATAAESIDTRKQQRLIVTAQHYLADCGAGDIDCRFDVVEVGRNGGRYEVIDVLKNAFSA